MHRNKVLAVLAVSSVAMMGLSACGGDAGTESTKVLKVAFNQNASHPQAVAITELSDKLKEATDGAFELELFPDEQLGSQAETLELVQSGAVDMAIVAGPLLEAFNPDFSVLNLPYVYDSPEHQMSVLNDPEITGELFDSLETSESISIVGAYHGGVRNVYTGAPVETPEDLAGQKIRIISSDTNVAMLGMMGGVGTPMPQGDVYTAIQSGVLDGAENNELIYADLAHAEIAKHYSYTKHLMIPDYFVANPTVMAAFSDEQREALETLFAESVDSELASFDSKVSEAKAKAEAAGATFHEADVEAFREAVTPLHEDKVNNDVTKAIFEKIDAAR
ncbi:TRAP transporter substrate-binding protein [Arthrobacter jiangjiafuii]|uniref:TRAP transporter substrate-binding protein n=1 Tax=Arthrobacter jiangjiafuii TaxID=2817475 RepID=A0A975M674_9MICC|nr:TRAP transporter substrate-binding protein [Arthrobacter jiangjiafuii]MBP3043691.1 TRAP transporter substrate-binding protein [Arthrobacter jiangjiafuii]QWC10723.1 TRAP transporter substrate-binding protein [Arthrobacter jiangjiafuii]